MKISLNITLNLDRAKPAPKTDDGPDVRSQVGTHAGTGFQVPFMRPEVNNQEKS